MKTIMENYNDQGYHLARGALSKSWCDRAKEALNNLEPKVKLPFSDIPWGFGQLYDVSPFDEILKNETVTDFCLELFGTDDYKTNHLLVSNKSSFIGPEEMWHQEFPNIDTFAPGCTVERDWDKFLQVVVAIDKMTIENGCLRIIPESHKLGPLEHEDIIWNNMAHKKRTKHSEMKKAFEKYGVMNCEIEAGDVLFFNHLLLHGSSSNISPYDRKVVIMQVQNHNVEKDMEIFNKATAHRSNFLTQFYRNKISSEEKGNKYADFNKNKK